MKLSLGVATMLLRRCCCAKAKLKTYVLVRPCKRVRYLQRCAIKRPDSEKSSTLHMYELHASAERLLISDFFFSYSWWSDFSLLFSPCRDQAFLQVGLVSLSSAE